MRIHTAILLITMLVVPFAAGCGSETSDEPEAADLALAQNSSIEPEASNQADQPSQSIAAGTAKAAKPNAPGFADPSFEPYVVPGTVKWESDDVKNAKIPKQVPVYTNATRVSGSSSSRMFVFEWASNDPKKEVMDFYRDELPKAGYKIVEEKSYGSFDATRNGEELSVWIGSPPNKPISILVRLEYK